MIIYLHTGVISLEARFTPRASAHSSCHSGRHRRELTDYYKSTDHCNVVARSWFQFSIGMADFTAAADVGRSLDTVAGFHKVEKFIIQGR